MDDLIVHNETRGTVVVRRGVQSRHIGHRLLGLLARPRLADGEGLWLIPCRAIHTFGMRFPIDAIFLDRTLTVVAVMEQVRPFRLGKFFFSAHSVLEVGAGVVAGTGTEVGDQLRVGVATPPL